MFTADDIQSRLKESPFRPVRLITTTGQGYDIFHPDMVLVGRRFLIVGLPSSENPTQAEQVTRVSILHVSELKDISHSANQDGNHHN